MIFFFLNALHVLLVFNDILLKSNTIRRFIFRQKYASDNSDVSLLIRKRAEIFHTFTRCTVKEAKTCSSHHSYTA